MTFHLMPQWLSVTFLFIFGTLIGSFLNVVIYRTPALLLDFWPEEEESEEEIPSTFVQRWSWAFLYSLMDLWWSISYLFKDFWQEAYVVLKGLSFPGSTCGSCQNPIPWYDNIPVLSWIVLRGRCRQCRAYFSVRYPMIEFLTGCLFVYVYSLKGFSIDLLFYLPLVSLLWAIFWIDFDTEFIFNVMTYPSIFMGILYNSLTSNLYASLLGGLIALGLFEIIGFLSIGFLGKIGMGGGDVKLAVLLGIWFGPTTLLVILALAFISGAFVGLALMLLRKESKPFPFGPFLVASALLSMSVGEGLWTWYIEAILL